MATIDVMTDARTIAAAQDLLAEVIRLRAALAEAERRGAEAMREAAADCAINAGRGSLADEIRALPLPTGSQS